MKTRPDLPPPLPSDSTDRSLGSERDRISQNIEAVSGYIKPFFKDMKVYDRSKDKEQGFGHQMYEMLVGGVASLLENRSHQEVATRADISGPVGNPENSTWQIIAELIKNAFFKAILPSFEKEATGTGKH